jgi:glycosyltransferase involved in cell wall biosynthesis
MARILYISYDGLTSHIGEAQVLPYLRGLAKRGHQFSIVSFELDLHSATVHNLKKDLESIGIKWFPNQFRKSPPIVAKLIDQIALRRLIYSILDADNGYDIVHSRSYVAAEAGLRAANKFKIPHIFDMRGFWVDQRREGDRWPSTSLFYSWLYRKWKCTEAKLLLGSSAVVVLTVEAKRTLFEWGWDKVKPCAVIPCAYHHLSHNEPNFDRRVYARESLGIGPDEKVLVYLGSLGSVYMLTEMLAFYNHFRSYFGRTRFFFLGATNKKFIQDAASKIGLKTEAEEFIFLKTSSNDVHSWLNAGDAAVCFISPTFSSRGVSPTKLAEYFAAGLPVVANSQIGDVPEIFSRITCSGVVVEDFDESTLRNAASKLGELIPVDRLALRRASQRIHDLSQSIDAYDHLYFQLIDRSKND